MPKFRVLRRVDAWIDYVAEIEAESPNDAALIASQVDGRSVWTRVGEEEFWNAQFATLDVNGVELPGTVVTRG